MAGVDRPEDQVKLDKIVREILPQVKQVKVKKKNETKDRKKKNSSFTTSVIRKK